MCRKLLIALAAMLVGACALNSDWMLFDRGYSLNPAPYGEQFEIRVHLNELKQLGGDIGSAEFRRYVSERLKEHRICAGSWEQQLCAEEALCVRRTAYSVTVRGRCVPSDDALVP
jgi:hypothetical protein